VYRIFFDRSRFIFRTKLTMFSRTLARIRPGKFIIQMQREGVFFSALLSNILRMWLLI
jgi:hypothetical protein